MDGNINSSSNISDGLSADHGIVMKFRYKNVDSYSGVPDPDLATVVHDINHLVTEKCRFDRCFLLLHCHASNNQGWCSMGRKMSLIMLTAIFLSMISNDYLSSSVI